MSTTLITVAQARDSVLEGIELLDPEPVAIDDALGRVNGRLISPATRTDG